MDAGYEGTLKIKDLEGPSFLGKHARVYLAGYMEAMREGHLGVHRQIGDRTKDMLLIVEIGTEVNFFNLFEYKGWNGSPGSLGKALELYSGDVLEVDGTLYKMVD